MNGPRLEKLIARLEAALAARHSSLDAVEVEPEAITGYLRRLEALSAELASLWDDLEGRFDPNGREGGEVLKALHPVIKRLVRLHRDVARADGIDMEGQELLADTVVCLLEQQQQALSDWHFAILMERSSVDLNVRSDGEPEAMLLRDWVESRYAAREKPKCGFPWGALALGGLLGVTLDGKD